MENIATDIHNITVNSKQPLVLSTATARCFEEDGKKRIGIKEEVIEELDTKECLTGLWKSSITPDGFYLCAHEQLYKDFENVFDFNTRYGCQINNPMMLLDENGQPDQRFLSEVDKTGLSDDYISSCKFTRIGKFKTTFVFASPTKDKLMKNKDIAAYVMDACRSPQRGQRIHTTENIIGYNCYFWDTSDITIIETGFGSIVGFIISEYVPKKKRSSVEEMFHQRFGEDDGKVFHFE